MSRPLRHLPADPGPPDPGPRASRARLDGGRGWVSRALLAEAVRRFREDWGALAREARWSLGTAFGLGFLLAQALSIAAVWLVRTLSDSGTMPGERETVAWFDTQTLLSFNLAIWIEAPGNGFVLWPLVLFAAGAAAWLRRPLHALSLLLGYGSVHLHVLTGWLLWERARPDLVEGGIGSPGTLSSFPSGHVAQATFAYGFLLFLWARSTRRPGERLFTLGVFVLVVGMVAAGRLRLGAHWPSDIAAALLIAGAWAASVAFALHRATRARTP
jgi:membrane-associated phospholipid phosphatase